MEGIVDGFLKGLRTLEGNDMAEVLLVIKDPIGPAKGLDQVLWAHRLAINKERRKTRCIKARQETIDHG